MTHVLDALRIVLDVAVFYLLIRLFGWMALVAPRAFWRGWTAENKGERKNPFKFGSWDHAAWKEGWDVSHETDPYEPRK